MAPALSVTAATGTTPTPCSARWDTTAGQRQLFLCSRVVRPLMPETRVAAPTVVEICSRPINAANRAMTQRTLAAATSVRLNAKATSLKHATLRRQIPTRSVGRMLLPRPGFFQRYACWRNIASLTMSAVSSTFRAHSDNVGGVKHFSRTLQRALGEERHFALVDGFAFSNPGSLVISQVGNSVRPMHLFGRQRPIMITTSNSSVKRSGTPNQYARCSTAHHGDFRAVPRANRI